MPTEVLDPYNTAEPPNSDSVWIVLPVKALDAGKQRLAEHLSAAQRQALCQAMLEDVLHALSDVQGVDGILVVSSDPRLQAVVAPFPVQFHVEGAHVKGDLNRAVSEAAALLTARGATTLLVLHGDLPLATRGDIEKLLALHHRSTGRRVTLVPDGRLTGTNVLLATPPQVIPFAYGANSFVEHRRWASTLGVQIQIAHTTAFALDVDTPNDLARLLRMYDETPALAARRTGRVLGTFDTATP